MKGAALGALSLFAAVCCAVDPAVRKLQKMQELESYSSDNIIELTGDSYQELVLENPRPYHVVVLYTVDAHCDHCVAMYPEYQNAVFSFKKQEEKLPIKTFYCVLYHTQATMPYFRGHSFNTVPYMAVSLVQQKRDPEKPFYEEQDQWYIRPDQVYESETIIQFVNKRLRTDVELMFPFSVILMKNIIFFSVVLTLLFLVQKFYNVLIQPFTWYIIAMTVFFICTGGFIHTVIHQTPWFKFTVNEYGQQVVAEYFMRGQRGQWAGEGYIVSFLTTTASLCATAIAISHKLPFSETARRMILLCAMVMLVVLIQMILECYKIKSPWYGPTFFPPGNYQRGPLSVDQGNNI